jgi:hypothetical protein
MNLLSVPLYVFPSMPCKTLCRHNLDRFHFSCLYCRVRRFHYGKMDPNKYHYNRFLGAVLPNKPEDMEPYTFFLSDTASYTIIIDKMRRFAKIKDVLLKKLLLIAEKYQNITCLRARALTMAEMLAN